MMPDRTARGRRGLTLPIRIVPAEFLVGCLPGGAGARGAGLRPSIADGGPTRIVFPDRACPTFAPGVDDARRIRSPGTSDAR
jgi:hypothetical protein